MAKKKADQRLIRRLTALIRPLWEEDLDVRTVDQQLLLDMAIEYWAAAREQLYLAAQPERARAEFPHTTFVDPSEKKDTRDHAGLEEPGGVSRIPNLDAPNGPG